MIDEGAVKPLRLWEKARLILKARHFSSEAGLWAVAILALTVAYFVQFEWVRDQSVFASIRVTMVNIIPVFILGLCVRWLVRRLLIGRIISLQLCCHILLSLVFTNLLYVLILLVADFKLNWLSSGFNLSPFYSSATLWQLLQGIVIYAGLLGMIYGWWLYEQVLMYQVQTSTRDDIETPNGKIETTSIFVKSEGEYKKIEIDDLIHIEADGDYVSLHTRFGVFQSSKSLNGFVEQLEHSGFIRVHRSHLVRAKDIRGAEPTGDGRLSMHLSNGVTIVASRRGSRAFRDYVS